MAWRSLAPESSTDTISCFLEPLSYHIGWQSRYPALAHSEPPTYALAHLQDICSLLRNPRVVMYYLPSHCMAPHRRLYITINLWEIGTTKPMNSRQSGNQATRRTNMMSYDSMHHYSTSLCPTPYSKGLARHLLNLGCSKRSVCRRHGPYLDQFDWFSSFAMLGIVHCTISA